MEKRTALTVIIVTVTLIIGAALASYLYSQYQLRSNRAAAISAAKGYMEAYGTYDSQNKADSYISSLKPYLSAADYSQLVGSFSNPNADQETRDYEAATKYRIKTTVTETNITALAKDYKSATVELKASVKTYSTEGNDSRNETILVGLLKSGKIWVVDQTNIPE